ncbi:transmembrane protein 174 [Polymixia lowei]
MGQLPQMETNSARNPATFINGTSDDLTQDGPSVVTSPHPVWADGMLDVEKTGVILLFSGIFLGLVGMSFTAMGWLNYDTTHSFEWTQLLGPILLSVGGTFMLISICKFGMSCQCCSQRDEEEDVISELDHIPMGHSFVFNGNHQPIMFHGATVVQYIPPPYASVTREANTASEFQPNGSTNGVPRNLPPQYYTVCPLDNLAFTIEEDSSPHNTVTNQRGSRVGLRDSAHQEDEKERDDDSSCISPFPPAYEDIYSLHSDTST